MSFCTKCGSNVVIKPYKTETLQFLFYYDKDWNEHLHDPSQHIDVWKCYNCGETGKISFRKKCMSCDWKV